jgi:hypothetical protein
MKHGILTLTLSLVACRGLVAIGAPSRAGTTPTKANTGSIPQLSGSGSHTASVRSLARRSLDLYLYPN